MCVAKLIERTVNSIPIGYLFYQSGGDNALLRILTPNNLRMISTGDRAPTAKVQKIQSVSGNLSIEPKTF